MDGTLSNAFAPFSRSGTLHSHSATLRSPRITRHIRFARCTSLTHILQWCAYAPLYHYKTSYMPKRCAKCLRFAPSFRTTRGGARCCTICLRFATAHRTTTVIQHRPSVNPSGFTAGRRRITAARYMK